MNTPIHDIDECTPRSGASVRVWLEDGTETMATFSAVWWDSAQARYVHPVRWQGLEDSWRGSSAREKQPELGLKS